MTSDRKIQANRANAQASTGPRTPRGRTRSARNAFRHGLSLPVQFDPALSEELQALAREIAGPHSSADTRMLARLVAEAQIDLGRVRSARRQLLSGFLNDPNYESRASMRVKSRIVLRVLRELASDAPLSYDLNDLPGAKLSGPEKFATILSDKVQQLSALDRYEQRALSRRKFAIREFDAARRAEGLA